MKTSLFFLGALAVFMPGCLTDQPVANVSSPETAEDGSSFCYVGMD